MLDLIWRGAVIGVGATILLDLWVVFLWKAFNEGAPNWAPPGRWVWHLQSGKVFHDSIAKAAPYEHELALGWVFHYVVGLIYGAIFALIVGHAWFLTPTFVPAWIWGIVTIAGGWFLLQPGLGIGWAASKTPNPWKVRVLGLIGHTVFALGLWATALTIR
jgi:hypothetical protein